MTSAEGTVQTVIGLESHLLQAEKDAASWAASFFLRVLKAQATAGWNVGTREEESWGW
jgi:hypothetical protein